MVWILLSLVLVAFVVWRIVRGSRFLRKVSKDSLIVFGKKGHGKSLLFSVLAKQASRVGYLSNTDFGFKNQVRVSPGDISLAPNDWSNVLDSGVVKVGYRPNWEGRPVLLDDAGIYLPNFADSTLKKHYPSLPLSLALWRQLYNAPIHVNSQDIGRTWKMVREQADGFIKCRRVVRLGPVGIIQCTYYDRYASACDDLAPMKALRFNKYGRSEYELYRAQHGVIEDFSVFVWLPHHKFDSRYFRKVFFGTEIAEDNEVREA